MTRKVLTAVFILISFTLTLSASALGRTALVTDQEKGRDLTSTASPAFCITDSRLGFNLIRDVTGVNGDLGHLTLQVPYGEET